jgi:XTP/dITP diphosphohydrolase
VRRLVVASQNSDKVREVEEVLALLADPPEIVRGLVWDEIDETEPTLEGNALLKARAVAAATGLPALSDDTGLEVDALGGAPGVHTARYAGDDASYDDNIAKVLTELDGVTGRSARFRTVVALVTPEGEEVMAEGVLEGSIGTQRRGDNGFGYDPVFVVDHRTLAEISSDEKHTISHRGKALRALVELLR